ncbi:MAG: hypothetical protein ACF8PG_10560 [Maioricimonas sp. JB045]|uniref:hypothetical protein n=1 Tax=Maioricimonas sp. JC845 TaxID=3232138 RepID=UPI0034594F47
MSRLILPEECPSYELPNQSPAIDAAPLMPDRIAGQADAGSNGAASLKDDPQAATSGSTYMQADAATSPTAYAR